MPRPRSARAHDDVLDAALRLFASRGIDGTSMDAIAETSGVSKATIYKHWPDKEALCLEVLSRIHGHRETGAADDDEDEDDDDGGDLRSAVLAVLSQQPSAQQTELRTRMMPHLMAYAVRNPAFGKAWRARVLEPPRARLGRVLARGVARGELPRTLDLDVAKALLLGPLLYGHVLTLSDKASPERLRETVVDAFMKCYALESTPPPPARRPAKRALAVAIRPSAHTRRLKLTSSCDWRGVRLQREGAALGDEEEDQW